MNKFYQLIQEWGRRSLGDILVEQFRRFKVWWLKTPPNPWPEELDEAVARNDSKRICLRCSTPRSDRARSSLTAKRGKPDVADQITGNDVLLKIRAPDLGTNVPEKGDHSEGP